MSLIFYKDFDLIPKGFFYPIHIFKTFSFNLAPSINGIQNINRKSLYRGHVPMLVIFKHQ